MCTAQRLSSKLNLRAWNEFIAFVCHSQYRSVSMFTIGTAFATTKTHMRPKTRLRSLPTNYQVFIPRRCSPAVRSSEHWKCILSIYQGHCTTKNVEASTSVLDISFHHFNRPNHILPVHVRISRMNEVCRAWQDHVPGQATSLCGGICVSHTRIIPEWIRSWKGFYSTCAISTWRRPKLACVK